MNIPLETFSFRNIALIKSDKISNVVRKFIEDQSYEQHEIDHFLAYAKETDVVLELGSSFGALSTVALRNKQVRSFVCVEANPEMVELLKINHKINNIKADEIIHGVMSGDKINTEFDFYIHKDCWASSLSPLPGYERIERVQGYFFNDVLKRVQPTFLICDIEGGEFDLFKEPCNLTSVSKICIEVHGNMNDRVNLYAFFLKNCFKIENIEDIYRNDVWFLQRMDVTISDTITPLLHHIRILYGYKEDRFG